MRATSRARSRPPASSSAAAPLQPHPGLREHVRTSRAFCPAERLDPQGYARYASKSGPHYRPLGGEALLETFTRIDRTLDELARAHRGEAVLLVTHGGVLDAVRRHVEGLPLERSATSIPNCGATVGALERSAILAWAETAIEAPARATRSPRCDRAPCCGYHGFQAQTGP